jgi:hypothetical protein
MVDWTRLLAYDLPLHLQRDRVSQTADTNGMCLIKPVAGRQYPATAVGVRGLIPNDDAHPGVLAWLCWQDAGLARHPCGAVGYVSRRTDRAGRTAVCWPTSTATAGMIFHRSPTPAPTCCGPRAIAGPSGPGRFVKPLRQIIDSVNDTQRPARPPAHGGHTQPALPPASCNASTR